MKIFLSSYRITFTTSDKRTTHRINGPANLWCDGEKWWLIFNNSHREDGPAFVRSGGDEEWYLFNYHLTKTAVLSLVANKSSDTYEVGDVLFKKSDLPKWHDGHFPDICLVKATGDPGFKVRIRRGERLFTSSQLNLICNKV